VSVEICFLSETHAWGGAEVHTLGLATLLSKRGHNVHIVALGHDFFGKVNGRHSEAPFKVQYVPLNKPVGQLTWGECRSLVRTLPGGVCILARSGLEGGSLLLDLATRQHFRRYIAIEHTAAARPQRTSRRHFNGWLPGLGLWWYKSVVLLHLRCALADLVVCVSQAARRSIIRDFRVPAGKVLTVHNGIDTDKFHPSPDRRLAARQLWKVPPDAFVFGSVGRLAEGKGVEVAIDAFGRLVARHPHLDLRLVLVGDGPDRESLQQSAQALGIGDKVVFAGFSAKPWEAYPGLDCFLLATDSEGLPLALIEAMASGCCPIAMAVGGVPEVISDPKVGWLVPPGDRDRFQQAMDAAVGLDPAQRTALAEAARAQVVDQFDAARQYSAMADLIEEKGMKGRDGRHRFCTPAFDSVRQSTSVPCVAAGR
jgi:glycosyltransferase involved in cell wall biosynthesis